MAYDVLTEGVYVLYYLDEIVYVGQSNNVYYRIGQHIQKGDKEFTSFDVFETKDRWRLEGFLIELLHPKYNENSGQIWYVPHNDPSFSKPELEFAVKSFETKPISVGTICDIFETDPQYVLEAIKDHSDEILAWHVRDDSGFYRWQIDGEWFQDNSYLLRGWVDDEINKIGMQQGCTKKPMHCCDGCRFYFTDQEGGDYCIYGKHHQQLFHKKPAKCPLD